jgi:hypothetical protein
LFVLSGAHGPAELLAADADRRPTHLGRHLGALLDPPRRLKWSVNRVTCGSMTALAAQASITLERSPRDEAEEMDALWAVSHLAWTGRDRDTPLDASPAMGLLAALA